MLIFVPMMTKTRCLAQVLLMNRSRDALPETAVDLTGQRVSGRVKFMFGARYCNYGAAQEPEVSVGAARDGLHSRQPSSEAPSTCIHTVTCSLLF